MLYKNCSKEAPKPSITKAPYTRLLDNTKASIKGSDSKTVHEPQALNPKFETPTPIFQTPSLNQKC